MPVKGIILNVPAATLPKIVTAAGRRGRPIVIECPLYTPTILDQSWTPTVLDGQGKPIPNPIQPQPTIANPVSANQFAYNLLISLIKQLIADDNVAQGDLAKIAADATNQATTEAARVAAVAAANASIDTTTTVVIQ